MRSRRLRISCTSASGATVRLASASAGNVLPIFATSCRASQPTLTTVGDAKIACNAEDRACEVSMAGRSIRKAISSVASCSSCSGHRPPPPVVSPLGGACCCVGRHSESRPTMGEARIASRIPAMAASESMTTTPPKAAGSEKNSAAAATSAMRTAAAASSEAGNWMSHVPASSRPNDASPMPINPRTQASCKRGSSKQRPTAAWREPCFNADCKDALRYS
mmetsp:Transcript_111707/g.288702  ORF Transcript_111707/g.288702 Transcript_111707/m.288702 type:complete len:221 (-) Transcript_111707:183-845(-)